MSYFDKCKVKFLDIKGSDIPDDVYFKLPGISNSRLKLIDPMEDGSPQKFKEGFNSKWSDSLELGSIIHCAFLQPDDYEISDYDKKPSAKFGYFLDCVFNYRKHGLKIVDAVLNASEKADYYHNKLSDKRFQLIVKEGLDYYIHKVNNDFGVKDKDPLVASKKHIEIAKKCLNALYKDHIVNNFLSKNMFEDKKFLNEISLFTNIEVTMPNGDTITLPFKGKLDQVIIDPEKKLIYLNDLKTTSKPYEMFMGGIKDGEWYNGSFLKLHYFRQFMIYLLLLQMYCEQVLGLTDYNYLCNVICVETTGMYRAHVYPINNSYIQYGAKEFKELICRVAFAELYGYDKIIEELS